MLKIKRKIQNPMTVIALFALFSETSAAILMPFLGNQEREIYVWFLISFPFYLLLLFFITLNFNYRSLYAPSDFDKDESFLKIIDSDRQPPQVARLKQSVPIATDSLHTSTTNTLKQKKSRPPYNAFATPPDIYNVSQMIVQHRIPTPKNVDTLHILDLSEVDAPAELNEILEKIRQPGKHTSQVIVLICNEVSDFLPEKNSAHCSKPSRKINPMPFCIVYNICNQHITVLDRI